MSTLLQSPKSGAIGETQRGPTSKSSSERKLRICYVCSEYPPGPHGGIGTLVQILARGMVELGHEARVIGICPPSYPAPDYQEDQGVQIWRLREPQRFGGWIGARLKLFRIIAEWAKGGKIDLVEVPDYGAPATGWKHLNVPVVTRLSGSASYFASEMGARPKRMGFYMEQASVRRSDFWCSESNYMAGKTQRLFGLRLGPDAVIYNPVEFPEMPKEDRRIRNRVVFAGTLTKKKGVISLIQSWPRVLAACPEADLHIWGKDGPTDAGGSMQRYLQSELEKSSTGAHFHGHVPLTELMAAFQTASVIVLPSYAEGFALTPLHAMASGCPTIYTRRGSGPELIEHSQDGLLIDPDRPQEIADAIICLLRNERMARQLGMAGRRKVQESFSHERLMRRNEAFYSECLAAFSAQN